MRSLIIGSRAIGTAAMSLNAPLTTGSIRTLSVQGYPQGDGPDKGPDFPGPSEPLPKRDPDIYPPVDKHPDTDSDTRDVNPDLVPPRFASPDQNPSDAPKIPEPPTPHAGVPGKF